MTTMMKEGGEGRGRERFEAMNETRPLLSLLLVIP